MATLNDFLRAEKLDGFFRGHWPDDSCVVHGPLTDLGILADSPWFADPAFFRDHFSGDINLWMPNDKKVHLRRCRAKEAFELYEHGATLYVTEVEKRIPELRPISYGLERDLGLLPGQITVEMFFSRAGSGTPPHFDADGCFNIQLRGRKRWRISKNVSVPHTLWHYKPVEGPPTGELARAAASPLGMPEPSSSFEARPGTVIFLPLGHWHETQALDDSIAIAFAFNVPSWLDLLNRSLRHALLVDPAWRRRAVMSHVAGDIHADTRRSLAKLLELVAGLSLEGLVETMTRPFASRYRVRAPGATRLEGASDVVLQFPGADGELARVLLPSRVAPTIRWMVDQGRPFTLAEAVHGTGTLGVDELESLLDFLVAGGVLFKE